jgi:hypothetical protein
VSGPDAESDLEDAALFEGIEAAGRALIRKPEVEDARRRLAGLTGS